MHWDATSVLSGYTIWLLSTYLSKECRARIALTEGCGSAQTPSEQISKIFPDTVAYYDSLEHMPARSWQQSPHISPGVSCANPPRALTMRARHKVNTSLPLPFLPSRLIFYLPLSCNTGYSGVSLLTAALNPKLFTRQHVGCRFHSLILANEVWAFIT